MPDLITRCSGLLISGTYISFPFIKIKRLNTTMITTKYRLFSVFTMIFWRYVYYNNAIDAKIRIWSVHKVIKYLNKVTVGLELNE